MPNGSGDDLVANLGIGVGDIDLALEYICKGDTIKMDVTKVLIDHETESDIAVTLANKEESRIEDYLRYNLINSQFCLLANIASTAVPYKPYIGGGAYTVTSVIEILKSKAEKFDIYIDKESYNKQPAKEQITPVVGQPDSDQSGSSFVAKA